MSTVHTTRVHRTGAALAGAVLLLAACGGDPHTVVISRPGQTPDSTPQGHTQVGPGVPPGPHGTVTLAFAGDLHFEEHLAARLDHPAHALGPIERALAGADLTMVNLESAITTRGTPEAKEIEVPSQRYHFRTGPTSMWR